MCKLFRIPNWVLRVSPLPPPRPFLPLKLSLHKSSHSQWRFPSDLDSHTQKMIKTLIQPPSPVWLYQVLVLLYYCCSILMLFYFKSLLLLFVKPEVCVSMNQLIINKDPLFNPFLALLPDLFSCFDQLFGQTFKNCIQDITSLPNTFRTSTSKLLRQLCKIVARWGA